MVGVVLIVLVNMVIIKYLLNETDCNPNLRDDDKQTGLYWAVVGVGNDCAQYLYSEERVKIDFDTMDGYGDTIIEMAIKTGKEKKKKITTIVISNY